MIKRPSAKDTEDDLLRFQEEFLARSREKYAPSNLDNGEPSSVQVFKSTKYKETTDDNEGPGDPAWFPQVTSALGEVVERSFDIAKLKSSVAESIGGFPSVETVSVNRDCQKSGEKRMSLFARQMLEKTTGKPSEKPVDTISIPVDENSTDTKNNSNDGAGVEPKVSGVSPKLMAEIDSENRKKLAEMTPEEIVADRAEVAGALSANLVRFLKNRKKSSITAPVHRQDNINEEEGKDVAVNTQGLPVQPNSSWVHMDKVEAEKLEWTKDVPVKVSAMNDLQAFETRFDFEGNIAVIPGRVEEPTAPPRLDSALYHHGDEPDRPGYTLSELLQLARSFSSPQRTMALRALATICKKARSGWYVSAQLSKPIVPCLLDTGYAFILRQCLDDSSSEANALAALTAMHSLLVEEADQHLHYCFVMGVSSFCSKWPYRGDQLISTPTTDENIRKLDDAAFMSKDVVACLVFRTNLIVRLRFILCDWPIQSSNVAELVIDILIRIAYHSPACAQQIVTGSSGVRLLEKICDAFVLENKLSVDDVSYATKCFRLLTAISQSSPTAVLARFDIHRLHAFLLPGNDSTSLLLATEANLLLSAFCQAGVGAARDMVISLGQRFVERETVLFSKAGADSKCPDECCLRYLSSIFHMFSKLTFAVNKNDSNGGDMESYSYGGIIHGVLEPLFVFFSDKIASWLCDSSSQSRYHLFLMLSSAVTLMSSSPSVLEGFPDEIRIIKLLETAFWVAMERSLAHSSHSILLLSFSALNFAQQSQRNESCRALQHLSALSSLIGEEDRPPVDSTAAWCLTSSVLNFLSRLTPAFKEKNAQLVLAKFIFTPDVCRYFKLIATKRSAVACVTSFFQLNFEVAFLLGYLSCLSSFLSYLGKNLFASEGDDYTITLLNVVFRVLPLIPSIIGTDIWSVVFDGFVFNPAILDRLDVPGKKLANNIQSVRSVYRDAIGVLVPPAEQARSFSQSSVCKDWPYFPLAIVGIRTELMLSSPGCGDIDVEMPAVRHRVVVAVLRFVRFMLQTLPAVMLQELTAMTHFVRLSSLYLNDDVFGGAAGELEGVRGVLADNLTLLLKESTKHDHSLTDSLLSFQGRVPGLDCTLADFYIALLEQFKAASYGDVVFGNILLIFANAKQPSSIRRLLWGDHREVLTFLRLKPRQLIFDLNCMLSPFEADLRMISLYAEYVFSTIIDEHAVASSVLWIIAVNHVNAFLFDSSSPHAGAKLRKSIWQAVADQAVGASALKKKKLTTLVFYKCSTVDTASDEVGISLYEIFPQNRLIFLRSQLGEKTTQSMLLTLKDGSSNQVTE